MSHQLACSAGVQGMGTAGDERGVGVDGGRHAHLLLSRHHMARDIIITPGIEV